MPGILHIHDLGMAGGLLHRAPQADVQATPEFSEVNPCPDRRCTEMLGPRGDACNEIRRSVSLHSCTAASLVCRTAANIPMGKAMALAAKGGASFRPATGGGGECDPIQHVKPCVRAPSNPSRSAVNPVQGDDPRTGETVSMPVSRWDRLSFLRGRIAAFALAARSKARIEGTSPARGHGIPARCTRGPPARLPEREGQCQQPRTPPPPTDGSRLAEPPPKCRDAPTRPLCAHGATPSIRR